jgi:hypothetical protein
MIYLTFPFNNPTEFITALMATLSLVALGALIKRYLKNK